MPTIEVSQEQADALSKGENITVTPAPPLPHYVFVQHIKTGYVYRIKPTKRLACGGYRGPYDDLNFSSICFHSDCQFQSQHYTVLATYGEQKK